MPEPMPQPMDTQARANVQVLDAEPSEGRTVLTEEGTPGPDHPSGETDFASGEVPSVQSVPMGPRRRRREGGRHPIIVPEAPRSRPPRIIPGELASASDAPHHADAQQVQQSSSPAPKRRSRRSARGTVYPVYPSHPATSEPAEQSSTEPSASPDITDDENHQHSESRQGPRRRSRRVGRHQRIPAKPPAPRRIVIDESGQSAPHDVYADTYSDEHTQTIGNYNFTSQQAQVSEGTAEYDALHSSPEGLSPRKVMRNGWLRATAVEKLRDTGRRAHQVFDKAVGTVGLKGVVEKVNEFPSGEYDTGSSSEAPAEMPQVEHAEPGAASVQEVTPEAMTQTTVYEPEAVTAETTEIDVDRLGRIRDAWRDFEAMRSAEGSNPADVVSSARHVLEVSDYSASTARKLAQDVMYHTAGPEAKAFVEELAQGRLETVNENVDDVRLELRHIAERTAPLPRLSANVDIPEQEVRLAQDGSVIFSKALPQVPDIDKPASLPSESGVQMHALRALQKGDFGGYQYLPEPVKAELERRQLRPGEANAGDKAAVEQISLEGARYVRPGNDRVPSEPAQIKPPELAGV